MSSKSMAAGLALGILSLAAQAGAPTGHSGNIIDGTAVATMSCHNGQITPTVHGGGYIDCRDGSVIDSATGLMWETAVTCGSPDDADLTNPRCDLNRYVWSEADEDDTTAADGTLFTDFLAKLNGSGGSRPCFANHCDWRIPTLAELSSIQLPLEVCATTVCIDPALGATHASLYWSSSTFSGSENFAFSADFDNHGGAGGYLKDNPLFARAVRGR